MVLMMEGGGEAEPVHVFNHLNTIRKSMYPNSNPRKSTCGTNSNQI